MGRAEGYIQQAPSAAVVHIGYTAHAAVPGAVREHAGFLLAVLAAENLIRPLPGKQRVHELVQGSDFEARMGQLGSPRTLTCRRRRRHRPKLPAKPKAVKVDLSKRKPGRPSAKKPVGKTA